MKDTSKALRSALAAAFSSATILAASAAYAAGTTSYVKVPADIPPIPKAAVRLTNTTDPVVTVDIALPARSPQAAATYALRVSTPGDPLHGHYLTPAQYAANFGPTTASYNALIAWAKANGLGIHEEGAARTLLSVTGRSSVVGQAFHVGFNYFKTPDGFTMRTATAQPSMPAVIAPLVSGVIGLSASRQYVPLAKVRPAMHGLRGPMTASGIGGGYSPADLKKAYTIPPPAVVGPKEVVAVFEQGGFFPSDIATFTKANKLPNVPVMVRPVNGYGGGVDDPDVELESALDLETLIGVNPGLSQIIDYEDGDNFNVALLDSLTAMATDRAASIISISYGLDENLQGATALAAENTVLTQLAMQGQTVLVSAGDGGAYGDDPDAFYGSPVNVEDPGSQPFVTSIGGTTLYTGPKATYYGEEAWNDLGINAGSTGGGVSLSWPLPSYQTNPAVAQSLFYGNGGSAKFRNVPDMAADASPFTGESMYSAMNGGWLVVGGTSLSAPIVAGQLSLADQVQVMAGAPHVGFFNPELYTIGGPFESFFYFHDIRDGSNGNANEDIYHLAGFTAGPEIDNVSGIGTFENGANIVYEMLGNAITQTSPPPEVTDVTGTVSGTSATIKWVASAGAKGYVVVCVDPYTNQIVTEVPTTGTTVTITGLTGTNVYYDFQIEAVNATGDTFAAPLFLGFGTGSSIKNVPHGSLVLH